MLNFLLLSGLDGTRILFEPFLASMPNSLKDNTNIFCYDLNHDSNQSLEHQCYLIEQQSQEIFDNKPIIIIAESYSGILAYQLLLRQNITIDNVFFVACFLKRPSILSKYIAHINISWLNILHDKLLNYLLFYRYGSDKLLNLFKQVLAQLSQKDTKDKFIKRCQNIACLTDNNLSTINNIECVYIKASHGFLVYYNQLSLFQKTFNHLSIYTISGSHFLLQTNPTDIWKIIENHLGNHHEKSNS